MRRLFLWETQNMTLSKYSTVASGNVETPPNGFPENMLPSRVNDAARELIANIRQFYNDPEWIEYLDGTSNGTAEYVATKKLKINGNNVSAIYHVGRRVKMVGGATVYATITAVAYGGGTTVTVDQNVPSKLSGVFLASLTAVNSSIPASVIHDFISQMVAGNTESGISVAVVSGKLNFTVSPSWVSVTGKPTTFASSWASITGKPSTFPPSAHDAGLLTGTIRAARYASNSNAKGKRTISTAAPSGGSDGDVWYRY